MMRTIAAGHHHGDKRKSKPAGKENQKTENSKCRLDQQAGLWILPLLCALHVLAPSQTTQDLHLCRWSNGWLWNWSKLLMDWHGKKITAGVQWGIQHQILDSKALTSSVLCTVPLEELSVQPNSIYGAESLTFSYTWTQVFQSNIWPLHTRVYGYP